MSDKTKKYTVIYDDGFFRGSHYHTLIKMVHIDVVDIDKHIRETYPNVLFVFYGHCQIA
jgi:hypothetical protein